MQEDNRTPLHVAAMKNNCDYLNNEPAPEDLLKTYSGNTPLLWGIANSSVSFVLALLNLPDTKHVNIKSTCRNYLNTPLILSMSKGWTHLATQGRERNYQKAIAIKLLQKGAEVNALDVSGRTALHYACLHRNFDAIIALVKAGADWNIEDRNSQTPMDFCCTDYETASQILQVATGGRKGETYTLVKYNFDSCDMFYQSLSSLISGNQFVTIKPLKQSYEFNKNIDNALAPIYKHAKELFDQYVTNGSFDDYATSIMSTDSDNPILFELSNSIGIRKLKSLLMLYFKLKNTASAHIDFSHQRITTKKQEIEHILNNSLTNQNL